MGEKDLNQRVALLVLVLALLASMFALLPGMPLPERLESLWDSSYFTELDQHLADRMPGQRTLRQVSLQLGLLGGQWEQNDIFISSDGLMKNIPAPDISRIQQNVDSLLHVSEEAGIPTYLMLVPTASAILQEKLPPYAELYNNQRQTIEDIYNQMMGRVTVIDVYYTLFSHRNEYIYYRTENNLTALGGYYVYTELGHKLARGDTHSFSQFEIQYFNNQYYGDLYRQSPYQDVRPDVLSLFRYSETNREYVVSHITNSVRKTYHTMYPLHLQDMGQDMDIYFGGLSAITHVRASNRYARSLLVLGDETALAYLPFLANNYQSITLVDLSQLTYGLAQELDLSQYDQLLYAFNLETFNSTVPIWAEMLL